MYDLGAISRFSPKVDEEAMGSNGAQIPLNELIDAINVVPTVNVRPEPVGEKSWASYPHVSIIAQTGASSVV